MNLNTYPIKEGEKVFWLGLDNRGEKSVLYGKIEKVEYDSRGRKVIYAEEIGGENFFKSNNPHNFESVETILKAHEIEYL